MQVREITEAEVKAFKKRGWTYLPHLFDREIAERLHARALELERDKKHHTFYGGKVNSFFRSYPGEDQKSPLVKFMFSPAMGRNSARLLGIPQVRLFSTGGYLLKMPEEAKEQGETAYHQDFLGNPMDRSTFLTVWVALHDIPVAGGTMRFYDRSHRLGVLGQAFADHMDIRVRYRLKNKDLSPPLAMQAGDATVHHSLTVHGAPPNRTANQRWGLAYIYMDADARYDGTPNVFTENIKLERDALFDHPAFPLIPTE
jgi:hypothetical protein